ncbi:MAG: magnesium transporter [bacterium]
METTEDVQQSLATSSKPADELMDLSRSLRGRVFFQLPDQLQETIVEDMDRNQLEDFVRRLDPDEATDVLSLTDEEIRESVLQTLDSNRREKLKFLLEFRPDSAAGIMDLDYITVNQETTLDAVSERVRRHEERTGRFPKIFVRSDDYIGQLPAEALAFDEEESTSLMDHVSEIPTVRPNDPDSSVIDVFHSNPEKDIAVVDEEDEILGVIHSADLLKLIEEEAGETLYEFTGVSEEESVLDGPLVKIKRRYRWLILNLGTAFLAAAVVGLFEETIAAFTLLAVYMPIVAGMGGNAGTQSMAITVRGIAMDQVSLATGGRVVFNEVIAGAANGAITGALVAGIATVFNQNWVFGVVLGVSMILNLVIAGFFGAVIPLVLDKLKFDPATSATIFITTATDVLGFFIFLWLAKVVL